MLNTRKRAASLVMTAVMLLTTLLPTACASRDGKDIKLIEETVQQFFEAFGSGDKDTLGDRLYYTIVKDGVENNEPRMLVYQDDYNGEFVLKFPDYEFTDNGSIELRLWEDKEMTHLLGYVEVIQT